jgi:hypothetical protein
MAFGRVFEEHLRLFPHPYAEGPFRGLRENLELSVEFPFDLPIPQGKNQDKKDEDMGRGFHGEGF